MILSPRPVCVIACVALTLPNSYVALRPQEGNVLALPSAGVVGGQGVKATACRAVFEQFGVTVQPCDMRAITFASTFDSNQTFVFNLFEVSRWQGRLVTGGSDGVVWVNPFNVVETVAQADAILLENVARLRSPARTYSPFIY